MDLSKYIQDLLYRYECVIIPEFGGFLTKTISAQIDEKSHTLYPPSKRLGFNSQLTDNDGLLANYVASVEKIPYEDVLDRINIEVEEWQKKLENEDLVLEEIGTFSLNEERKLNFEPDPNANFLTDAFGLSNLVAPEVSREDYLEEEVVFDSISDIIATDEIYINTEVSKRSYGQLFKYAATIAFLMLIAYVFTKQVMKNNALGVQVAELEADNEKMINKRIQEATFEIKNPLPAITLSINNDEMINEETLVIGNENALEEANESEDVASETENSTSVTQKDTETSLEAENSQEEIANVPTQSIKEESTVTSTSFKYHIIGGAFKEPSNADKKVRQLKAKGFDARIVGVNKWQLTQVAFGSYATKEEAQVELNNIRQTEAKDAWLLIK